MQLAHALDVDILRNADVGVPQNRLDGFIVNAKGVQVCRKAAPEGVPAVPQGKGTIALPPSMTLLVFLKRTRVTDRTANKGRQV